MQPFIHTSITNLDSIDNLLVTAWLEIVVNSDCHFSTVPYTHPWSIVGTSNSAAACITTVSAHLAKCQRETEI